MIICKFQLKIKETCLLTIKSIDLVLQTNPTSKNAINFTSTTSLLVAVICK